MDQYQLQQCVASEILEKIDAKESFTAYDITKAIRADGTSVYHSEVRDYVHDFMQAEMDSGREYKKTLECVTPTAQAFVYSPDSSVIDDDDDDDDYHDNDSFTVDKRGRLLIPAYALRLAGFSDGNMCWCHKICGKNEIIISKASSQPNADILAAYTVDCYNNIKISPSILSTGIGNDAIFFRIKVDNDNQRILVTEE